MLVILILQNRRVISGSIRGHRPAPGPGVKPSALDNFRSVLADVWHVIAILYLIALFFVWALQIPGGFNFVQGGQATWENIVTACLSCNNRKGGRTPWQAGMRLIRPPVKPRWMPVVTLTFGIRNAPLSWRDYLYWNIELNKEQ